MNKEKTIFIAIGAYNESYLEQTIRNCINKAKHPERLRFGVWSHNNDNVLPSFPDLKNVRLITVQYPTLLGVCPSRIGAIFLYDEEDYFLQIDGHMLFQQDWDDIVIEEYENISVNENCEHPLITTYVPWWYNDENGNILQYSPERNTWKSYPLKYSEDGYTRAPVPVQDGYAVDWSKKRYHEHFNLSAHFIFTRGSFVRDVLPDIDFMFFGEEMTTALRAWTRGYRLFCIPDPIVYHYNKGAGNLYKNDRWVTVGDEELYRYFDKKQSYSHQKTRDILTGKILGYWGAPSIDLLKAYEKAANISFEEWYQKRDMFLTNEQNFNKI
jgi:hypothetical protein